MSFLKRLFGQPNAQAREEAASPAPSDDVIAQCRARVAQFDRRTQPAKWAEAMQLLGYNLMAVARYAEAETALIEAHNAAGPLAHPHFRASILKILGETRFRHSDLLTGDARGMMLADAANTLGEVLDLVQPHENRTLWMESATFRGAALHELGRLHTGPQGLAWMDEAAACFAELATRGAEGQLHPIGLYNRYAVLEQRAQRTEGAGRADILREARQSLVQAMDTETFADRADLAEKLNDIDTQIAVSD